MVYRVTRLTMTLYMNATSSHGPDWIQWLKMGMIHVKHLISTAKHHDVCSNLICQRKLQTLNAIEKQLQLLKLITTA